MSEKEFYVEHTETGLVHAEDRDEAFEKAVNGESETGWNTLDLEVEEVTEEDYEGGSESDEIFMLSEQDMSVLRRGGTVEVGDQLICLDENAEDKHGLGDVV